jgi:Nif-specific regulatory protein
MVTLCAVVLAVFTGSPATRRPLLCEPATDECDFASRCRIGLDWSMGQSEVPDVDGVRRERDLYLRLLELGHENTVTPFLQEALSLLGEITCADEAYLELFENGDSSDGPRWWAARGLSSEKIQDVRTSISRGIIAEAVKSGQTVVTQSALLDPRFCGRDSVAGSGIEAVLCAPIGADPPRGVLYVTCADPRQKFSEEDQRRVELVTRHLAPLTDRLLLQERLKRSEDATHPWRRKLRLDGLIGRSNSMAEVLREVAVAAPSSKTVLLVGETGTGKSHLARLIHENGPRAGRPFVEVNCTSIPENLVEAELFGYKRGAFTGAIGDRIGLVGQAERGSIFLDEIGDLPWGTQAKLLHLLQSKEYRPLSNDRAEPLRADIRIIAGTNVDLVRAVEERKFRQDLLFRLDVITIRMPSLAERRDDIPELAAAFCVEACRSEGHAVRSLAADAIRALETAEWPGNVRQLENAVLRGVLHAVEEGLMQVERRHLFRETSTLPAPDAAQLTYQEATRNFQRQFIEQILRECGGNVSEAARQIDVSRTYLHELKKALGIDRRRAG